MCHMLLVSLLTVAHAECVMGHEADIYVNVLSVL